MTGRYYLTLAALIIVGDDMPQGRIVGLEWPEFLVRRAALSGAAHIVLLVDRVPRALVASVDRIRADGIAIDMVRNAADAADRFHPDEAVLVLRGHSIIAQSALNALTQTAAPALLCVASPTASESYERIDAAAQWPGAALIDGAAIRATAAIVGEWDMGSTLLRQAVQSGATRIMVEHGEAVLPVTSPAAGIVASRVLVDQVELGTDGWGEAFVVAPAARAAALAGFDHALVINRVAPWIAVGSFGAALLAAALQVPSLAAVALLLGFVAERLVSHVAAATHLRSFIAQYLAPIRSGAAGAALTLLVLPSRIDHAPLALAVTLAAVTALAARLRAPGEPRVRWLADVPGQTVLIGLGGLFGHGGLEVALAVAVAHGIASLGWLQNRLSTVLTTPR